MGDLYQLPDVREAEREASEWIARLQADDVSAEDRARFEAWRSAHPQRAEAYEKLMGTWRQFAAAGPLVRAVSFAQSVSEPANLEEPHRRWMPAALAASLLLAVIGGLYFVLLPSGTNFTTAVGEQAEVSLPDGSTIKLNSNSVAHVDYRPDSRIIQLEKGEAYFKVAHDVNRPFWVVSGKSWVRAVGTEFNVYVHDSGVRVIVNEGKVKVGYVRTLRNVTPSDAVLGDVAASFLTAGQQAELSAATTVTTGLSSEQLVHTLAWRDGVLYFENRSLGEVVEEVSRYTTTQLIVDDERLRQLVVGGTFQANPQGAEALLTMLEQGFGLDVRRTEGAVYIDNGPDSSRNQ